MKVLALFAVTCVLLVLAAELAVKLRFFGWHSSPSALFVPSDNPELIFELRPDTRITSTYLNPDVTDWKYSVSVNERGFRGALATEGDRLRIVVLGDSYAFGLGVDDDEPFPRQLQYLLGDGVEVLNWGVPAYNLVQEVALFEERAKDYAPDIVVQAFHPNDFEPAALGDAAQVRWSRLSHLYSLLLHVRWMLGEDLELRLARDREARVARAIESFDRLRAMAREQDFELVLFKASCWLGRDQQAVDDFFARARALGVTTLDTDPPFCRTLDRRSIPGDGHPTREGHAMLSRRLAKVLGPLVQRLGSGRPAGGPRPPRDRPGRPARPR